MNCLLMLTKVISHSLLTESVHFTTPIKGAEQLYRQTIPEKTLQVRKKGLSLVSPCQCCYSIEPVLLFTALFLWRRHSSLFNSYWHMQESLWLSRYGLHPRCITASNSRVTADSQAAKTERKNQEDERERTTHSIGQVFVFFKKTHPTATSSLNRKQYWS